MKSIALFLTLALIFGCNKSSMKTQAPTVTMSNPVGNQVFNNGQMVTISAVITDLESILVVQLHVQNKTNSADVLYFEEHPNTKTYNLTKSFTVQTGNTYQIEVEAVGPTGEETKVEVEVTAK